MKRNCSAFGPWSTSLDAGGRLELSAFWKRRMVALARLPAAPWRLRRRWLAVSFATMAAVASTPLWRISPSVAIADERSSDGAASSEAEAVEPFVARFSNGVEVELIGLSMNPSKGHPWWRPDGSPLEERPYASVMARMGSGLTREICWRRKNLPKDPDYTLCWSTVPAYEAAGGMPVGANGKRVEGLWATAVGLPGSPETCAVRLCTSVSATPWKTVFTADGLHYASSGSSADGKPRGVIWSPAREEDGELVITVSFQTPGEATRLVAVDTAGGDHPASKALGGGAMGFTQHTFVFDELSLDEVDKFELQTQIREIETIEFTNVSLEPGKRTKVTTQSVAAAEPKDQR